MPTSSRSYWYNRNLVIIANIERQFLGPDDLKEIHYYFGKHRKKSAMITHLKIQYALGLGPGIHAPAGNSELSRSLPYLAATPWAIFLWFLRKNRIDSYQEFLENSPGIDVKTRESSTASAIPRKYRPNRRPLSRKTLPWRSPDARFSLYYLCRTF